MIIIDSGLSILGKFKDEAIARIQEGKFPVASIAEELGISNDTLYTWVKNTNNQGLSADQVSESERNQALVKENFRLKMEV